MMPSLFRMKKVDTEVNSPMVVQQSALEGQRGCRATEVPLLQAVFKWHARHSTESQGLLGETAEPEGVWLILIYRHLWRADGHVRFRCHRVLCLPGPACLPGIPSPMTKRWIFTQSPTAQDSFLSRRHFLSRLPQHVSINLPLPGLP